MLICLHELNIQADLRLTIITFNSHDTPASPSAETFIFIDSQVDNAPELMASYDGVDSRMEPDNHSVDRHQHHDGHGFHLVI